MAPVPFAISGGLVSEGPQWLENENSLYWVDIAAGLLLRKKAGTQPDVFETFAPGLGKIGAFAFGKGGKLLLFTERCEVHETEFGGKPVLKWILPGHGDTRFNDVFDAGGGVYFCGVAPVRPARRGELWRFDAQTGSFTCIEQATDGMPNGMGLSPDGKTLYFVVSDEHRIYAYDFDPVARTVSGKRVFCEDFPGDGAPDGLCVDSSDGSLYVAIWGGHRLEHRAPDGHLLESIPFKAEKVSSATVVGDIVYVTTANVPFDEKVLSETGAGNVFMLQKRSK